MAIAAGTLLGRYKIRSPLGAGGMGEVYLAEDIQLERSIALKVLPSEVASDQKRMARFKQEARAASVLNHPNVAHIYEIGEAAGIQFIAMEFVEGRTLRHEIASAGTKTTATLEVALQVAAALSAAHAAGIVHRDIKPENIMLRPDGYVKVLDFGLAKLTEARAGDSEASTLINTDPGIVIGTVQYMSPEQARGREVDARTDIFSLGCVLYEMIAGRAPFEGETKTDVIDSILNDEPPPLARYSMEVPETLEWIINKALRKDREERYQTAKELLTDLRSLKRRLEFAAEQERSLSPDESAREFGSKPTHSMETLVDGAVLEPPSSTQKLEAARSTTSIEYLAHEIKLRRRGVALALAGLLMGIAAVLLGLKYLRHDQPASKPTEPFGKMKVMRLTTTGTASDAVISPDGKYVVHVMGAKGQQSLWLRHIATGSDKEIVPSNGADLAHLTFTHDGSYIYFARDESGRDVLFQVPVLGGAPKRLLSEDVDTPITLSPDEKRYAFLRGDPARGEGAVIVANADGSGEQKLVTGNVRDFYLSGSYPAWSPDGEVIAYGIRSSDAQGTYGNVKVVRVKDGVEKTITSQRWASIGGIGWLRDGSGLVITAADQGAGLNRQIWYVSYPNGEVRRITNDPNNYQSVSITGDSTALVTVQTEQVSNIWMGSAGEASRATQITSNRSDGTYGIAWTPDGRIVYTSRANGSQDIWIINADGTGNKQLTVDAHSNVRPSVSPDGRYILFSSNRTGKYHIWRMDIDGSNQKELTVGSLDQHPQCTPDGQWVIYTSNESDIQRLWRVPIDGGAPVQVTGDYYVSASKAVISPDGKQIACGFIDEQAKPRRWRMAVIPFEGGPPVKVFDFPQFFTQTIGWTLDGRALTYVDTRAGISNIWSQPLDGGKPVQLTDFKSDQIFTYAWSRDRKQLALARGTETSDVVLISDLK